MAISCKNLVNFGPVRPEFKRGKDVHPLVDQQLDDVSLAAPLLDLAGSVLSFLDDQYSVLFQLFARGRHCYAAQATHWALPRISSLYCS